MGRADRRGVEQRSSPSGWLSPDLLILLALVATTAGWATRARLLSGVGLGIAGSVVQATVWLFVYVALGRVYRGAATASGLERGVLRRLGCALLLGFMSAAISKQIMNPLLAPLTWYDFWFVRQLVVPVFVGIWCVALLPGETRRLVRAADTHPAVAPFPQLALFGAAAAVLVSCTDLAFQFADWSGPEAWIATDQITPMAWVTNTLLLFSAFALVFAVTARVGIALVAVGSLYTGWAVVNQVKLQYMHVPVQPLDVILIPELLPLIPRFFGREALVGVVAAVTICIGVLVIGARLPACRMSRSRRVVTGLLSVAVFLTLSAAFVAAPSHPSVNSALLRLGAPQGHRDQSRRHGLLLTFLAGLPAGRISAPPGYGEAAVATTLNKFRSPGVNSAAAGQQVDVNLIIYLVESFMDPDDLGFRLTSDPIPNIRALRQTHGVSYAIVPGQFGGSANTEFEVLTGMTMAFLPGGSVPYKRYLWRPIPSLARVLRDIGYSTVAIQADPKFYFRRERAYDVLGFDRVVWLHEAPETERDARGTGLAADAAVVRAVIEANGQGHPLFAFAFTTSTHAPYNTRAYKNSDLNVVDGSAGESLDEIKEYINALRVSDEAVGALIRYFRGRPERTLIAVVGDHLPPVSTNALQRFFRRSSGLPEADRAFMTRRVPLLVWSNFDLPRDEGEWSTNALPAYLLEKMGIAPTELFAVNAHTRRRLPVLGRYCRGAEGKAWRLEDLPADAQGVVEAYRLLQYDMLFGKQYSLCCNGRVDRTDR